MVTAEAYKRSQDRKDRSKERGKDRDEETHAILNEIARMRGYEEKLVGKRKISPILQYVDYILGKKYGFKLIKRGEEYYSRKSQAHPSRERKIAEEDISPLEQYIALLEEQKIKGFESEYKYHMLIAKKEGFEPKKMGFESYEQYRKYVNGMWAIKNTYTSLIPEKDFEDVFRLIEERWRKEHEKFIAFSDELWKDSLKPYFEKTGKGEAVIFVSDVQAELDKFHHAKPGSMNIYNIDDIVVGLSYCLKEKGVDVILSKDSKTITFRKIEVKKAGT